jgi:hypothetical protein
MSRPTTKDVNEVLGAKKINVVKSDFNGARPEETKRDVEVKPLIGSLIDLTGKKLKADFTVVRNGQAIKLQKGMSFDEIPAEYKSGPDKILFKEKHFE